MSKTTDNTPITDSLREKQFASPISEIITETSPMSIVSPEVSEIDRELEELLNTLPMNLVDFSRRSDMYALLFGMRIGSTRTKDSHTDPVVANSCLRQAVLDLLVSVAGEAEKLVGYLMKDRYVTEEVPFIFDKKLETTFGGVETMNVIRTWEAVVEGKYHDPDTLISFDSETIRPEMLEKLKLQMVLL